MLTDLAAGWRFAPGTGDAPPTSDWLPATLPGDVATLLRQAGRPVPDLDAGDWWFETDIDVRPPAADEELTVHLAGVSPFADVFLDGVLVARVDSMHLPVDLTLKGSSRLQIRCRALGPVLAASGGPRARWRTRVADGALRHVRTTLLGRAPGFAPGPPIVGPWRAVSVRRQQAIAVDQLRVQSALDLDTGIGGLHATVVLRPLGGQIIAAVNVVLTGKSGTHRAVMEPSPSGWVGSLDVPDVVCWWPHTHGRPVLHDVALEVTTAAGVRVIDGGRVGFRALRPGVDASHDVEIDGLQVRVNAAPVFLRGAVWTRPGGPGAQVDLRQLLELVRAAGMNTLRIPGTAVAEGDEFYDLCDELGIFVWQDLMLANFDYPSGNLAWRALVLNETTHLLQRLADRPSTLVLCGGSEVEQQAAMMGVPADQRRSTLLAEDLPSLLAARNTDVIWVPNSPCGGDVPFRTDVGIAHYFGAGGYRRPLSDIRLADVKFASECLALAHVGADAGACSLSDPDWTAGIPRDVGADWDFADARDHYLAELYGLDPETLKESDPQRYLMLSQSVSGQLAAEVFGEWRRPGAACGGGLMLWLSDQRAGPGWGLLDHQGRPKPVMRAMQRILAPQAVWTTDEGLNGLAIHVANDGPAPLTGRLRVTSYRMDGTRVDSAERPLELPPRTSVTLSAEQILGHFTDLSGAYRFGPAQHDVTVVSLDGTTGEVASAFRWRGLRPASPVPIEELHFTTSTRVDGKHLEVLLASGAVAHGVRLRTGDVVADDDLFDLEPGRTKVLRIAAGGDLRITALNGSGEVLLPGPAA